MKWSQNWRKETDKPAQTYERHLHLETQCHGNGQPLRGPHPGKPLRRWSQPCIQRQLIMRAGTKVVLATWPTKPYATTHCRDCAAAFGILHEADTPENAETRSHSGDSHEPPPKKGSQPDPEKRPPDLPQEAPSRQAHTSAQQTGARSADKNTPSGGGKTRRRRP